MKRVLKASPALIILALFLFLGLSSAFAQGEIDPMLQGGPKVDQLLQPEWQTPEEYINTVFDVDSKQEFDSLMDAYEKLPVNEKFTFNKMSFKTDPDEYPIQTGQVIEAVFYGQSEVLLVFSAKDSIKITKRGITEEVFFKRKYYRENKVYININGDPVTRVTWGPPECTSHYALSEWCVVLKNPAVQEAIKKGKRSITLE